MDFNSLKKCAIGVLKEEINPNLLYHSLAHTLDVFEASGNIALAEKISEKDTLLIQTAALLHDIGFTKSFTDHENNSVKIATLLLPDYGYKPSDITLINNMILKTKLPQKPETLNEMVLCDADLDNLGRKDFYIYSHRLRLEMAWMGKPTSLTEWYQIQYNFLSNHIYFTKSSQKLRELVKHQYLTEISELLNLHDNNPF